MKFSCWPFAKASDTNKTQFAITMSQLTTNITEVELVGKRNCTKFVVNNTTCYENTVGYSISYAK